MAISKKNNVEANPAQKEEKTGRTLWDVITHAFTKKPKITLSVASSLLLMMLLLIFLNILGFEYKNQSFNLRLGKSPSSDKADTSFLLNQGVILKDTVLAFCFDQGYKYSSPLIIKSLIVSVRLELIGVNKDTLLAQERINYTVVALRDIFENENVFVEDYSTSYASKIKRWFGTEQEQSISMSNPNQYYVVFECKKGETKTIITGADYYYKYPLQDKRSSDFRNIVLGTEEDLWIYPNKDDVIGDLTIIIESASLKLIPFEKGAMQNIGNTKTNDKDIKHHYSQSDSRNTSNTISASWSKILPDQIFGLRFRLEK